MNTLITPLQPEDPDHIAGICIWCKQPFDQGLSEYFYGHTQCGQKVEVDDNARMNRELLDSLPVGTMFEQC